MRQAAAHPYPAHIQKGNRQMRITKVTPMTMGTDWHNITFVKVETDEGITGIAGTRPQPRRDGHRLFTQTTPRYVLGADPFDIELLVHHVVAGLRHAVQVDDDGASP